MSIAEFSFRLVNDLGVFALITMGYGLVLRQFEAGAVRNLVLGAMFGYGALWAMANTVQYVPGVFVDPRCVMIALAGPFGGPVAAILTALLASAFRLWWGGAGAVVGTANIIGTALIGVVFASTLLPATRSSSMHRLVGLGLASNVGFFTLFALPFEIAWPVFASAFLPLLVANTFGVVILGRFLCRERRDFHIERALETEAYIDPLTKLPNRRKLERLVDPMIDQARIGAPLSVLVVDIDHFKQVNDRFGHDIGDVVLQKVAAIVHANIRRQDAIARFGGEEIVVAMPGTEPAAASAMADRIRELVARETAQGSASVTVSIGVASQRGAATSFKGLFKFADEALYLAKQRGRNQVVLASTMPA